MSVLPSSQVPKTLEPVDYTWHGAVQRRRKPDTSKPVARKKPKMPPTVMSHDDMRTIMKRLQRDIEEETATARLPLSLPKRTAVSGQRTPVLPLLSPPPTLYLPAHPPQMLRLYTTQEFAALNIQCTCQEAHKNSNTQEPQGRPSSEMEMGSSSSWRPALVTSIKEEKPEKLPPPPIVSLPTEDMPLPELPFMEHAHEDRIN